MGFMRTSESINPDAYSTEEQRWSAVLQRDSHVDGQFYYSVKTTGVYCRPSCASRPALRKNVNFHSSCEEAERAGFRACKRCRPNSPSLAGQRAAAVARACRLIQTADEMPNLATLAASAGMSGKQ